MTKWLCRTMVAAIVAVTASGCSLYFGDDTGDDCQFGFGAEDQAAFGGVRNPQTNQCDFVGGGGGGCGRDANDDDTFVPAPVDWAQCFTECEGLDESSCFAADRCRATYLQCPPGSDCFREFAGCVGIAPSGPITGEACQGLDAYGCSQHNDCVAIYGTTDLPNDGYEGTGVFIGCDAEPTTLGCFSDNECPAGFECSVNQGDCTTPPGCGADGSCDQACFGRCVPTGGQCAAVDCGPGFHCEEVCPGSSGNDREGAPQDPGECQVTCVPDQNFCPIECPDGSLCLEVCPPCNYPGDPSCNAGMCHYECQQRTGGVCDDFDCGFDSHCEERCFACDPLPDGSGCGNACEPFCVPNSPDACDSTMCGAGDHCEVQCRPSDPTDPMTPMSDCTATCVPDAGLGCAAIDCAPGAHCVETCAAMPCMDPAGCPELCRGECVPDGPGECHAPVSCDALPPVCPAGTVAGVANGCWTGYCIPTSQCDDPQPPRCNELDDELSCLARAECTPLYTGTCWPNPDGTFTCIETEFARCESRIMPF